MSAPTALADARGYAWLEDLDPRLKLGWLVWVSTLSVLLDATAALAALCALAAVPTCGLKMQRRGWLVIAGLLAAAAWGTLLSQAMFYAAVPRTSMLTIVPQFEIAGWQLGGLRLYREGAVHGLAQSLRMLAVMLTGLSVVLSTSPDRLLAGLARLRVPVAVCFMTVAALRFVPLLLGEVATVRQAQRLRGYRHRLTTPSGWVRAVRMESAVLLPVMTTALRRAQALATSAAMRGFDPQGRRTFYPPLALRAAEVTALVMLSAVWLAIASAKLLYWLYLAEVYYLPGLRPLYDAARTWL